MSNHARLGMSAVLNVGPPLVASSDDTAFFPLPVLPPRDVRHIFLRSVELSWDYLSPDAPPDTRERYAPWLVGNGDTHIGSQVYCL